MADRYEELRARVRRNMERFNIPKGLGIPSRPPTSPHDHVTIPVPLVAPLGVEVTAPMVQEVWDTFVKPDQEAGIPQSGEMRVLMAILRAVYVGLTDTPAAAVQETPNA